MSKPDSFSFSCASKIGSNFSSSPSSASPHPSPECVMLERFIPLAIRVRFRVRVKVRVRVRVDRKIHAPHKAVESGAVAEIINLEDVCI